MSARGLERALVAAEAVQAARPVLEGRPAWIVGGAVRNALLGEEVHDIDLAVEPGSEEDAARAIARSVSGFAFPLSVEHATWRSVAPGEAWHADVTALRADTIESDLRLRDFTLNAVGLPLGGGEPIDPTGGQGDAAARRLRAVSDHAFADDPVRLLRAPRLAARYGLELEPGTVTLARSEAGRASEAAGERQFAELRAMLAGPDPLRALRLIDELDLTPVVLPEVEGMRGIAQTPNHHLDVYGHTLAVLEHELEIERDLPRFCGDAAEGMAALLAEPLGDEMTRGDALRFGALLHDAGKPATRKLIEGRVTFIGHDKLGAEVIAGFCERMKTSRRVAVHLQGLSLHHLHLGFMVHERPLARRRVYEYLRLTEPVGPDVTLLTAADRLAARGEGPVASDEMISAHLELVREMLPPALAWHADPPRPPVSGRELADEADIEPGPRMGEILEELRAAAYAGEIEGRDQALDAARRLARQ